MGFVRYKSTGSVHFDVNELQKKTIATNKNNAKLQQQQQQHQYKDQLKPLRAALSQENFKWMSSKRSRSYGRANWAWPEKFSSPKERERDLHVKWPSSSSSSATNLGGNCNLNKANVNINPNEHANANEIAICSKSNEINSSDKCQATLTLEREIEEEKEREKIFLFACEPLHQEHNVQKIASSTTSFRPIMQLIDAQTSKQINDTDQVQRPTTPDKQHEANYLQTSTNKCDTTKINSIAESKHNLAMPNIICEPLIGINNSDSNIQHSDAHLKASEIETKHNKVNMISAESMNKTNANGQAATGNQCKKHIGEEIASNLLDTETTTALQFAANLTMNCSKSCKIKPKQELDDEVDRVTSWQPHKQQADQNNDNTKLTNNVNSKLQQQQQQLQSSQNVSFQEANCNLVQKISPNIMRKSAQSCIANDSLQADCFEGEKLQDISRSNLELERKSDYLQANSNNKTTIVMVNCDKLQDIDLQKSKGVRAEKRMVEIISTMAKQQAIPKTEKLKPNLDQINSNMQIGDSNYYTKKSDNINGISQLATAIASSGNRLQQRTFGRSPISLRSQTNAKLQKHRLKIQQQQQQQQQRKEQLSKILSDSKRNKQPIASSSSPSSLATRSEHESFVTKFNNNYNADISSSSSSSSKQQQEENRIFNYQIRKKQLAADFVNVTAIEIKATNKNKQTNNKKKAANHIDSTNSKININHQATKNGELSSLSNRPIEVVIDFNSSIQGNGTADKICTDNFVTRHRQQILHQNSNQNNICTQNCITRNKTVLISQQQQQQQNQQQHHQKQQASLEQIPSESTQTSSTSSACHLQAICKASGSSGKQSARTSCKLQLAPTEVDKKQQRASSLSTSAAHPIRANTSGKFTLE